MDAQWPKGSFSSYSHPLPASYCLPCVGVSSSFVPTAENDFLRNDHPPPFQRNLQHTNQKNRLWKQISDRDIRSESASCLHWQLGLHFCSLVLTTIILPWYSTFTFSRVHTQVRMWPLKNVLTPYQENFFFNRWRTLQNTTTTYRVRSPALWDTSTNNSHI